MSQVVEAAYQADARGESWAGRRVTVIGMGRSGQAAVALLRRAGCRVRATDAHDTPKLRAVQASLLADPDGLVEVVELGCHTRQLIESTDLIVVSPGIPERDGPIPWALDARIPVISEIELAFHFCPSPVIAVTGTNGKSTTVTLIAELLRAGHRHAVACGNLGIPFSSVVNQLTPASIAVVEVSSFQLLWCAAFHPKIGVLLNVAMNHLDRHPDPAAYFEAKARLFQRQTPDDVAVLNGADPRVAALGDRLQARRVWFGDDQGNPPAYRLSAATRHALSESQQAVLQVGRTLGMADPLTWQVIRSFRGLEHRLEHVATVRGIRFVNDAKSTTPDSLLFALRRTPGPVVLLLGGRDKGLDFESLVGPLRDARIKGVVLIGESRQKLRRLLNGSAGSPPIVREGETLDEAIRAAVELAEPGTTILFSPACASFDMFQDFEDRGRTFKRIVGTLAE